MMLLIPKEFFMYHWPKGIPKCRAFAELQSPKMSISTMDLTVLENTPSLLCLGRC